ncbi:hypothetical protein [Endozoicomonas numazuensis]|nr:hypothetical protein [Endozoicomonas numazuensis]
MDTPKRLLTLKDGASSLFIPEFLKNSQIFLDQHYFKAEKYGVKQDIFL